VSGGQPPEPASHLLSGRLTRARGSPASRFTFSPRPGRPRGWADAGRRRHAARAEGTYETRLPPWPPPGPDRQ